MRAVYGEDAPLYVHTDNARPARGLGGLNFSRLCAVLGCEWSFSEDAAGQPSAYQASGLAYAQVASQMRPEGEPEPWKRNPRDATFALRTWQPYGWGFIVLHCAFVSTPCYSALPAG